MPSLARWWGRRKDSDRVARQPEVADVTEAVRGAPPPGGAGDTDIGELRARALAFNDTLEAEKRQLTPRSFEWYPYGTLSNFIHLDRLLTGERRFLLALIGTDPVVDIGAADGDLAFFLETLGCQAEIIDYGPTNFNGLRGARALKGARSSSVAIHEINLDAQFALPHERYGLAFFLGILYHLKNPFYALEALAKSARYCLISTRIACLTPDKRTDFSQAPMAYLLGPTEANNDSTNYWIFSEAGLRRLFERTGWDVCDYLSVGNTVDSDPASPEGDERAFCMVKSRHFA